jgi:hypothetical protein
MGTENDYPPEDQKPDLDQFLHEESQPEFPEIEEPEIDEEDTIPISHPDPKIAATIDAVKKKPDSEKYADVPAIMSAESKRELAKAIRTAIRFLQSRGKEEQ